MRSIYKRIGDYISRLNEKNKESHYSNLLGININKYFMPSVANVVGTDLSKYKIVKPGQFACNRMHVGRDYRLPIALSKEENPFLVSPAYDVFEINDTNKLLPDYLMMWFSRAEFDRNSWFYTDTDVRGKLGWDSFCQMELPIPSIEKQQAIVDEYNTIVNRISLNEQLNTKLEETAQALYKHWFVDFEFPFDFAQGKPDVKGKPYKSSGGAMVYNEELDREIPEGWEYGSLGDLSSQFSGFAFKGNKYSFENGITVVRGENVTEQKLRWDTHKKWALALEEKMKKNLLKANDIVIGMDGSKVGKNWSLISKYDLPLLLAQRVTSVRGFEKQNSTYIYFSMMVLNFEEYVSQVQTGTSVPHISGRQISDFPLLLPETNILKKFHLVTEVFIEKSYLNFELNKKLEDLNNLLLSRMSRVEIGEKKLVTN